MSTFNRRIRTFPPLRVEIDTLFGNAAYDDKQHYLDFITRFVAVINSPFSYSPALRNYLLSEGGRWAMDGTPLGATHLLYWLDLLLKEKLRDLHGLYVNRLSEAGASWGLAAPTTLLESDPLGLVATIEALTMNVALVDFDAASSGDNITAGAQGGCVRIDRTANNDLCNTLDGNDKTFGSSDRLINGTSYRYKYWKTLDDFNEASGGRLRFPSSTKQCVLLIRYSDADHIVSHENQLGITLASQIQSDRITIRGYPGEWPEIWCGNSADSDVTPTTVPNGNADATSASFTISPASDKGRNNVHWRNIVFHGKRLTAGGKWFFTEAILSITGNGTNHSVRHCQFLDFQPLRVDDPLAGTNAEYVDEGTVVISGTTLARGSESTVAFTAIDATSASLVIDSNYFRAALETDFPHGPLAADRINATGVEGMCIDLGSSTGSSANTRVTRNRIEGVKHNSAIRAVVVSGLYIADNDCEVFDKTVLTIAGCSDGIIERNRLHDFANNEHADEGGGNAISLTGCSDFVVRHNILFNRETSLSGGGITIQVTDANNGSAPEQYLASDNVHVYENIIYRSGVKFDHNDPGTTTNCEVYNNLISGMIDVNKDSALTNAPVYVSLSRTGVATLEGNEIYENNIWRFDDSTPTQGTIEPGDHLMIRTGAGTSTGYETTESVTGWYDNTQVLPVWTGLPESDDFRVASSNAYASWFPANMPFRAADSKAWTVD